MLCQILERWKIPGHRLQPHSSNIRRQRRPESLVGLFIQTFLTNANVVGSVLLDEQTNRTGDLYIRSICFSPDGKYLATGAEDRQIRVS